MTGGLHLRVDLSFRGSDLTSGSSVLANVYPVDETAHAHRGVLIPAGDHVRAKRFQVDAGRYVVEAVLPSGKVLTEETTVADGQEVTLALDATDSPHESHAWQYFAGNIEPRHAYESTATIPTPRSMSSRYFDLAEGDPAGSKAGPAPAATLPSPTMVWVPDSRTEGWSFERQNRLAEHMPIADIAQIERVVSEGPTIKIAEPTETDLTSHLYRFDRSGPVYGPGSRIVPERARTGARQFVIAAGAGDAYLVTLPNPWMDVHSGADVQVELLVNARQSPTGSPVAVTVRDPTLGNGLAYLASGAFSAAARVFQDVERMLYGKVTNPLAAAAGAYVLVGTETDRTPKPWHHWLDNLARWFGWMSDGMLLRGIHLLRGEGEDRIEQGKAALKEAYRRGVPLFTAGVSWLIEGLSEFPDDEECSRIADEVRRLSWRIDTRQPFVVLRLNGRTR
jgi:hypothetical protein